MWLFKEIINEAIEEALPSVLNSAEPDDRFTGERYCLDLGSGRDAWPIVNVQELRAEFDKIRNGDEPTADMVRKAASEGFFNVWITKNSVAQAIGEMDKKSGGDGKFYVNKGIALEYIFGKERDNDSKSDIIGAELKAYAQSSKYVTLFSLTPYEILHYPGFGAKPERRSSESMLDVLESIRRQTNPEEQTRFISSDEYTDFMANCRSYARVILNEGENGRGRADFFSIYTQFFKYDKDGNQVPINAIECIYSIKASQKILYSRRNDAGKKNLYHTIADKIKTIFSFSTTELKIDSGGKILVPGNKTTNTVVYAYNKLHISEVENVEDLMLNFLEGINSGDIVVSFRITKTLTFGANFMIQNTVGAYDRLYKDRNATDIMYQNEGEQSGGEIGPEALVPKMKYGAFDNDFSDWTDSQEQKDYQAQKKLEKQRARERKKAAEASQASAKEASKKARVKKVPIDQPDNHTPGEPIDTEYEDED